MPIVRLKRIPNLSISVQVLGRPVLLSKLNPPAPGAS
jgi:hypothetical protein